MRLLIKYFKTKEYAEMFKSGKLYMNSLSYFWDNGFESQKDVLEGICETIKKDEMGFSTQMKQLINGDTMFRLEAYKYCNLYCFYRIDIMDKLIWNPNTSSIFPDTRFICFPDESMKKFGNYVAIIKDEKQFFDRLLNALDSNWICVAGDVSYSERSGITKPIRNEIIWASQKSFPAKHRLRSNTLKPNSKDCFDKTKQYENQKEWRICLFRNIKDEKPYTLDLGDLSDIVEIIESKEISYYLINKYAPCINGNVPPQFSKFIGNVTRNQFKEKLYEFDEGMGKLITVMGA